MEMIWVILLLFCCFFSPSCSFTSVEIFDYASFSDSFFLFPASLVSSLPPSCLCLSCSFLMHLHLNNRVIPPIYYCMSVKLKLHLHDLFSIWPFLVLFFWITVIKWSHLKQLILQKKKTKNTISCTFKTLGDMVNSQYLHRGLKILIKKKDQVKYSVNQFISHRC